MFVNREDFMLNPTSCKPMNFSATVIGGGAEPDEPGGQDPVTVNTPFRVTACQALKFEPKFAVSTTRQDQQSGRRIAAREPHLPHGRAGQRREHQTGQSGTPESSSPRA